jgi:hypothetical protein
MPPLRRQRTFFSVLGRFDRRLISGIVDIFPVGIDGVFQKYLQHPSATFFIGQTIKG